MGTLKKGARPAEGLRRSEFHQFRFGQEALLFQPETLEVVATWPGDEEILTAIDAGASLQALGTVAEQRVAVLAQRGFLRSGKSGPPVARPAPPSGSVTVMVNLAQRCNLDCTYCYVDRGRFDYRTMPRGRMDEDTAERLLDWMYSTLPAFDRHCLHFYGGEPLLNAGVMVRMVDSAKARAARAGKTVEFHITTNGTLITDAIADFMDRHRFTVFFSIDGDQHRHDQCRPYADGRGSFADVAESLRRLRARPNVHLIGSSVIRDNLPLHEAVDLLRAHGTHQCKVERAHVVDGDPHALHGESYQGYLNDIEFLADDYIQRLSEFEKPMDFRLSSKILQLLTKSRRDTFCPAGDRMFGISVDGDVYPCALHVGRVPMRLGHVDAPLDRRASGAFRHRFGVAGQTKCQACWNRHLCGGGCSAMVDRFGSDDCAILKKESEAAIAVYHRFVENDPLLLLSLVSPATVRWAYGLDDGKPVHHAN